MPTSTVTTGKLSRRRFFQQAARGTYYKVRYKGLQD